MGFNTGFKGLTNHQKTAIYGKEWEVSVLFRYFRILMNFEPAWGGPLSDWLRAGWPGDRIPVGGEIFRICSDRPWGPPSLLYNRYRVFPGGKERPGRDPDPTPPSSAVGYERVELYLYSPYGPYGLYRASVPVQGWPLPFILVLWMRWTIKYRIIV